MPWQRSVLHRNRGYFRSIKLKDKKFDNIGDCYIPRYYTCLGSVHLEAREMKDNYVQSLHGLERDLCAALANGKFHVETCQRVSRETGCLIREVSRVLGQKHGLRTA